MRYVSAQGVDECMINVHYYYVCVCVYTSIVRNKLIRGYARVVHTSSSFGPHTPFEDCKTTGLGVDVAVWSGGHLHYVAVKDLILGFP